MNKKKIAILMLPCFIAGSMPVASSTNENDLFRAQISRTVEHEFVSMRDDMELTKQAYLEEKERQRIEEEKRLAEEAERKRLEEEQRKLEEEKRRIEEQNRVPTYNPYDLSIPSNITREQAYKMLEGTALQAASNAYVYAEEVYGVNAIWLMSLNAEESDWGRSSLAMSHNNLGGVKNGNDGWRYFENWGECIYYIADLISTHYLSPDGLYYNGKSIWNVNVRYCEGTQWAENINSIAYQLLNKIVK